MPKKLKPGTVVKTPDIIDQLADAIALRVRPSVPFEVQLWTVSDVAAYLKVAPNKVVERYASLPDFPGRIELPTSDGRKSHPRWKAAQVVRWVEGYLSK